MTPAPRSCLAVLFALAVAFPAAAALPVPERVSIPSLERDASGAAVAVPALYFRPDAAAGTRVPLVIAVHGCGGMYSAAAGREGQLSRRFGAWTEVLLRDGYAVLWPDSFAPRGRREICTIRIGDRTITAATRRLDALGALAYAAGLPGVDRARVALVGWSHGGSTALATINARDARVAAFRAAPDAPPFFVAAVAFYPGCAGPLRQGARWSPGMPTTIHIGASDDWTPAAPCVELGSAMRERGEPVTVTVHPDSYHGFDAPDGRVAVLKNVPNGVNPGQGVTVGPNPAAYAAATEAVRAFLRERLAAAPAR
jgi:dienelactone hydrolase